MHLRLDSSDLDRRIETRVVALCGILVEDHVFAGVDREREGSGELHDGALWEVHGSVVHASDEDYRGQQGCQLIPGVGVVEGQGLDPLDLAAVVGCQFTQPALYVLVVKHLKRSNTLFWNVEKLCKDQKIQLNQTNVLKNPDTMNCIIA